METKFQDLINLVNCEEPTGETIELVEKMLIECGDTREAVKAIQEEFDGNVPEWVEDIINDIDIRNMAHEATEEYLSDIVIQKNLNWDDMPYGENEDE